jgi:cysteine-rich secretory family protein
MTRVAGAVVLGLLALRASAQEEDPHAVRAKVVERCAQIVDAADAKALDKLFEEVLALYTAANDAEFKAGLKSDILGALRTVREKRLKAIDAKVRSIASLKALAAVKADLNRRREAAIKVIVDPAVYVPEAHADWAKGEAVNGQAKVDALVLKARPGSVEELWVKGGDGVVEIDLTALADAEALQDLNVKHLAAIGEKPEPDDLDLARLVLSNPHPKLDLRTIALDAKEAETFSWNARVETYNAALADAGVGAPEKEHAQVINAYREMMGRRKLFLDARLCRATKRHSAACDAAKKIWHDGPDGSAQSRAREEGFPEAVGENVAIGFAHPAELWWKGWFRASDHHRNALSDKWTCMGYGYSGAVGTENFSTLPAPKSFPGK